MNTSPYVAANEFQQVLGIIHSQRSKALQAVNNEHLLAARKAQAFVSAWGGKTVKRLPKYLQIQTPTLRGHDRSNIHHYADFLDLPKNHPEKKSQNSILDNMKDFVLELGKDFLFYDKEVPLRVGNSTFKVDLLFYHRGLQCLVAIELKTGAFEPGYMGQLEFYLEALDRDVRRSNENPSIGILLCQEADRSVVEYAMNRSMSPSMVAEYKRQLIPKDVLQRSVDEFIHCLTTSRKKIK